MSSSSSSCYTGDESLFQDATIIIPSVSQASLPQLTVDILIHSLGLRKLGKLNDGGMVVPLVGEAESPSDEEGGEDGEGIVTGGIEVYGKKGVPYVFLQQRAPTIHDPATHQIFLPVPLFIFPSTSEPFYYPLYNVQPQSQKQQHVSLIASFLTSYPFRDVLLLTSLDSAAGTTEDHLFNPLQVLSPPPSPSSDDDKKEPTSSVPQTDTLKQRLSRIPEYIPPSSPSHSYTPQNKASSLSSYPPFLPNGGLARRLLLTLHQQSSPPSLPHATLVYWCAEADNRDDALRFAGVVTYALGIPEGQVTLSPPKSWDGLFGSRMSSRAMGRGAADIYG